MEPQGGRPRSHAAAPTPPVWSSSPPSPCITFRSWEELPAAKGCPAPGAGPTLPLARGTSVSDRLDRLERRILSSGDAGANLEEKLRALEASVRGQVEAALAEELQRLRGDVARAGESALRQAEAIERHGEIIAATHATCAALHGRLAACEAKEASAADDARDAHARAVAKHAALEAFCVSLWEHIDRIVDAKAAAQADHACLSQTHGGPQGCSSSSCDSHGEGTHVDRAGLKDRVESIEHLFSSSSHTHERALETVRAKLEQVDDILSVSKADSRPAGDIWGELARLAASHSALDLSHVSLQEEVRRLGSTLSDIAGGQAKEPAVIEGLEQKKHSPIRAESERPRHGRPEVEKRCGPATDVEAALRAVDAGSKCGARAAGIEDLGPALKAAGATHGSHPGAHARVNMLAMALRDSACKRVEELPGTQGRLDQLHDGVGEHGAQCSAATDLEAALRAVNSRHARALEITRGARPSAFATPEQGRRLEVA